MKKGVFGMTIGMVVTLILILMFVVVSFGVFNKFKSGSESVIDVGKCKASLEANAKRLEFAGIEIVGPLTEVDCGGYEVVINEDDDAREVLADLMTVGRYVDVKYGDSVSKEFVPGIWATVNRGQDKYFDGSKFRDKTFCIPWAYISSEGNVPVVDNFLNYFSNTKIEGFDYTYGEYVGFITLDAEKRERIDLSENYILMFVQTNSGYWTRIGTTAGAAVGFVAVGVLTVLPVPGSRVVAAGLVGGGALTGYSMGTSYDNHESVYVLIPNTREEVQALGCNYKK